jgi:hypothetical protein
VVVLAHGARAQSFNIDIGHWGNAPSNACGAATGQKGFWNVVGHDTAQVALLDLTAHGTNATIAWPTTAYDDGIHELAGNDAQMLNDYQLVGFNGGPSTNWSIQGLQNGPYRVTFYSRLPNGFGVAGHTDFTLSGGALGTQNCTGILDIGFNGYRYGVHMAQDTTVVSNGTLAWNVFLSSGEFGAFNGVQIEALVPGTVRAYCTAKTNSLGCVPAITSSGVPSVTGTFSVLASSERSHRPGFLVWSRLQNGMPYFEGSLCVASQFVRTAPQDSGGTVGVDDCSGTYSFAFDATVLALAGLSAGDVVACQYWSIDEASSGGNALTRGLTFVIAP